MVGYQNDVVEQAGKNIIQSIQNALPANADQRFILAVETSAQSSG